MSHYLTKEEIEAKTAEVNRLQEDPDYCLSLVFHKDAEGWAAEVRHETEAGRHDDALPARPLRRYVPGQRTLPDSVPGLALLCHARRYGRAPEEDLRA